MKGGHGQCGCVQARRRHGAGTAQAVGPRAVQGSYLDEQCRALDLKSEGLK